MITLLQVGKMVVPFNANVETKKYYAKTRPIDIITGWIKERMYEYGAPLPTSPADRILFICAKTGSGKSTTLPLEVFRLYKPEDKTTYFGPSIICTQPRVFNAVSLVNSSILNQSWSKDMILGETIGYMTGPEKVNVRNGLIFATVGSILVQINTMSDEEIMNKYRCIILDEVHERSIAFDLLVGRLKKFIWKNYMNNKCPFILFMSATFSPQLYSDYLNIKDPTIFSVEGNTFPIEVNWLKTAVPNIFLEIINIVETILKDKFKVGENDILIFLPGKGEIKKVDQLLENCNAKLTQHFYVCKIDREAIIKNNSDYRAIFKPYKELKYNEKPINRRIILITSVGETGITIPTLRYVIDTGISKIVENYPPLCISGLVSKPSSMSIVLQRRGRVGRLFAGIYYALFTHDTFLSLDKYPLPNIISENIDSMIYNIFQMQEKCFNPTKIDLIDPPAILSLIQSIEKGIYLGFIESDYSLQFRLRKS